MLLSLNWKMDLVLVIASYNTISVTRIIYNIAGKLTKTGINGKHGKNELVCKGYGGKCLNDRGGGSGIL